jgi:DeoR/GlpR family transcriptional regulator of sugar metabolism
LTAATHDPTIAAVLTERTNLTLITIGGQVNPFVGAAVDGGRSLRFWGFAQIFSCWEYAIDADDGLAAFHSEDAQMKRALLERSGSAAIAVLNEKLSASAPFQVGAVDVVADLVVEADAPKKIVSGFELQGIRLHRAKALNMKSSGKHIVSNDTVGSRSSKRP